jgi:aldose 1-epimerase
VVKVYPILIILTYQIKNMRFTVSINNQQSHPVITLKDKTLGSKVEIFAFGGLLNSFSIPYKKGLFNCVDGFATVADAKKNISNGFKSAKIAPFVCRLNKGQYQLNAKIYTIQKHYMGAHAIHGLVFDQVYKIGKVVSNDESASVELTYSYAKTDKGYPFRFDIRLCWKLTDHNRLSVTTEVMHKNKVSIPYTDGWHPYFKLQETINDCSLQFNCEGILEYDEALIPTGKILTDTTYKNKTIIGNASLDNGYLLDTNNQNCILENDHYALIVRPDKHYSYLQLYTPPHRNSIAIENLSAAPDCFNNKMGLHVMEPQEIWILETSYQLIIK